MPRRTAKFRKWQFQSPAVPKGANSVRVCRRQVRVLRIEVGTGEQREGRGAER